MASTRILITLSALVATVAVIIAASSTEAHLHEGLGVNLGLGLGLPGVGLGGPHKHGRVGDHHQPEAKSKAKCNTKCRKYALKDDAKMFIHENCCEATPCKMSKCAEKRYNEFKEDACRHYRKCGNM